MECWLRCKSVGRGQFPGEYAVVTSTSDGRIISLFASGQFVQPEKQLMRVELLEQRIDGAIIFLPATPFEANSRTVRVPAGEVVSALGDPL
jgi:hypothetical protein